MATIVPTAPLADLDLAAAKCFRRLTHQDETGTVGRRDRASDEEHAAIPALPPAFRRRLMVTVDGAGANHSLLQHLHKLDSRPEYQLTYSLEWALTGRDKIATPVHTCPLLDRTSPRRRADRTAAPRTRWGPTVRLVSRDARVRPP